MHIALTGGASGIGAEVAYLCKERGHRVTAFDISEPKAPADDWIPLDLSDASSIASAIASATGPFDALINNAGLPPRDGLEQAVLQINYFGLVAFLDGMLGKLSPNAAIVNTASRAGANWRENLDEVKALRALDVAALPDFITQRGIDPTRAYNLSKEALIVMTMARTEEMVARRLRMNSVSPAAVSTGILDDFAAAFGQKMVDNVARAGRPGTAREAAEVICFLASPQSQWIKGQDIVVDGGMSAMIATEMMELGS